MNPSGRRTLAACVIAATIGTACRDEATPTPTAPRTAKDVVPGRAIANVSFDITFSSAPVPPGGLGAARFHIDRTATSSTGWRTSITVVDQSARAKALRASWSPTRFEIDEDGVLTVRRADGSTMQPPAPGMLATNPLVRDQLKRLNLPSVSPTSPVTANHPPGTFMPSAWSEGFVRTAADCANEVVGLKRLAAFHHRDADGNDHYVRGDSRGSLEAVVNPTQNAVIALSIFSGATTTKLVSDYIDGPAGIKVRRRIQVDRAAADGTPAASSSRQTTITLSNVTVDGREVLR
jgi:hypothetical protein